MHPCSGPASDKNPRSNTSICVHARRGLAARLSRPPPVCGARGRRDGPNVAATVASTTFVSPPRYPQLSLPFSLLSSLLLKCKSVSQMACCVENELNRSPAALSHIGPLPGISMALILNELAGSASNRPSTKERWRGYPLRDLCHKQGDCGNRTCPLAS